MTKRVLRRRLWWLFASVAVAAIAVMVWVVASPIAPVTSISREDVEGRWVLDRPEGHTLDLDFAADGSFLAEDWLTQLGCPTWPEGLRIDGLMWEDRTVMRGTWDQTFDPVSHVSSQVDVLPATEEACSAALTFLMQRNFLTGESYLLIYLDGLQQEDQVLRFERIEG